MIFESQNHILSSETKRVPANHEAKSKKKEQILHKYNIKTTKVSRAAKKILSTNETIVNKSVKIRTCIIINK